MFLIKSKNIMKRVSLLLIVFFVAACVSAQNYSSAQEMLRSQLSSYLLKQGLNPEEQTDGLRFKSEGGTYFIEIDKESKSPMFVRLCRYIKYNDTLTKSTVASNIDEYNDKFGVKVYTQENSVVISGEMFVTKASEFTYAFNSFLDLLKSSYKKIMNQ